MDSDIVTRLKEYLDMIGEPVESYIAKTKLSQKDELTVADVVTILNTYTNISGRWLLTGEGHALLDGSFNIMKFHADNVNLAKQSVDCEHCIVIKSLSTDLANERNNFRSLVESFNKLSRQTDKTK